MKSYQIPFNKIFPAKKAIKYLGSALKTNHLQGDGPLTQKCQEWMERKLGVLKALLTPSGTSALEMSALLTNLKTGDEVIVPSFTFSSTANAFILRGAKPVFVDIRPDTLNIDENKIEEAVTPATKAIVVVHYGGVACDMQPICTMAEKRNLIVIEDSAQAILSTYKGFPLGSLGALSAISFHGTKNITCGEGGALLINRPEFISRAEIIREKGTNRKQFLKGEINKYTWVDIGSSYLPSELQSAFLWAQIEKAEEIIKKRLKMWNQYHKAFESLEKKGRLRRPIIPPDCRHNGHLYYLLLPDQKRRDALLVALRKTGIEAVIHYVPLDTSPAGIKYGRSHGNLVHTRQASERLLRIPLWVGLEKQQDFVIEEVIRNCS